MANAATDRVPRTLILCFDGTADAFDDDATNVVRLFSALEKERPDQQLCYYQPGIGGLPRLHHMISLSCFETNTDVCVVAFPQERTWAPIVLGLRLCNALRRLRIKLSHGVSTCCLVGGVRND